MEIKFQTEVNEDYQTEVAINKIESGIFLTIRDIEEDKLVNTMTHFLSKEDLKDFIGALLHVQSKLRQ